MRKIAKGRKAPIALAALAVLGLAAWGRGGHAAPAKPAALPGSGTAYAYVVDWSKSSSTVRHRLLGAALAELEGAPEGTRVVVYRMASSTQEVYDGTLGEAGADGIAAVLARDALPSDARKRTDFSRMARALADFSRSFGGRHLLVRVLTDGGDDFAKDGAARKAYRRAAGELCADRRLADLAFYGVRPGFREGVREAFGKAGARLRILDGDQPLGE